jgi:carboxypeptidase Q
MRVLLILAALLPGIAVAEGSPPVNDLERLRDAAVASDGSLAIARHLTDAIGPRLSGSAGHAAAVQWLADELRRSGLEVRLEKVMVPHWVRGEEHAELAAWPGAPAGLTQKLHVTALGGSGATPPAGSTAEVVVVKDVASLAALPREKVQGKIVLVTTRFDRHLADAGHAGEAYGMAVESRSRGPGAAAQLGAVALLIRSVGGAEFRLPHTGATRFAKGVKPIPAGALSAEDADLVERLAATGPVRLHLTLTPQTLPDAQAFNVIADLRGSEKPEEIVILSGHLDSWDLGTGAIDDAAGVGQAVEAVRLVKQLGLKPRRTMRIVAWANEENGLRGGKAYARDHAAELPLHQAALESDFGAGRPLGVVVAGDPSLEKLIEPALAALRPLGASTVRESDDAGADLIPLHVGGVPGLAPNVDGRTYFDYHHTAADTFDKIDPRGQRENTAVMAVLGYHLATMPERLPQHPQPMPDWLKGDE